MVRQFFHRLGAQAVRIFDQPVRTFTSGGGSAGESLGPSLDNIVHVRASNWHVRI